MTARAGSLSDSQRLQREKLQRLSRPALWVIAARLKTLSLSVAPVIAGTLVAARTGDWRADVLICALISSVAIQIGTNLWNDAADAARGVDTHERLGPPRVTALGLLDARTVRQAAMTAFAVAMGTGLYLASIGGTPIVVLGLLSLAMGYLYSMGPWPLSMTPFGEILVVVFFGIAAVAGTSYLHTGSLDMAAVRLGAVLGLPAAAVLLLNNHRDRRTDAEAGRRTLAILAGEHGCRILYAALLFGTVAGMGAWATRPCGVSWWPLAGLAAWSTILVWQMATTPVSAELNRLLPRTALFQLAAVALQFVADLSCGI